MDAEDNARAAFGEGRLVIVGAGPVRRPDLDELRPGSPDDLRDPDSPTDLDELAAADDDAATAPGEADGQGDSGRVVVRDERVLRTRQGNEVLFGRPEPRAATPRIPIELEEEVVAGGGLGGLDRRLRPRGASEVRVDDDAGRIDRRHEGVAASAEVIEPGGDVVGEGGHVSWLVAGH
jgi:hypothetical protein